MNCVTRPRLAPEAKRDTLLDLLLYCQDSFKHVEGILAALVTGVAARHCQQPGLARYALALFTGAALFAAAFRRGSGSPLPPMWPIPHLSRPRSNSPASASFQPQHLVYDWGQGEMVTPPPEHSYSHYMVAQLRLDPSLVVEQTG